MRYGLPVGVGPTKLPLPVPARLRTYVTQSPSIMGSSKVATLSGKRGPKAPVTGPPAVGLSTTQVSA